MCCWWLLQCTGVNAEFLSAHRYLELMLGWCLKTAGTASGWLLMDMAIIVSKEIISQNHVIQCYLLI